MDGFEKIIKTIREEANRNHNPFPIKLGMMTGSDTCSVGALELESEDLMVADHLDGKLEKGDEVLIVQISSNRFAIMERMVEM